MLTPPHRVGGAHNGGPLSSPVTDATSNGLLRVMSPSLAGPNSHVVSCKSNDTENDCHHDKHTNQTHAVHHCNLLPANTRTVNVRELLLRREPDMDGT